MTAVLRSDWITQGPLIERFETAVAAYCGTAHGVALNSATSALHAACVALGLGPGGRLWTTPNTFVASANCALFCGAQVDFVDIDPATANMSSADLEARLIAAQADGTLPDIVVPVHFAGQSCDMRSIAALAGRFGFRVIEDASHAIGGRYLDAPIGSCRYSDVTVFSFHPVKIITTGEGGMALTRDSGLAEHMRRVRNHGLVRDPGQMTHAPDGPWYYQQLELGYNYRMTDIQAALGLSQLQRLDELVRRRNEIAARYAGLLDGLPLQLPVIGTDCYSAFHLYTVRVDPQRSSKGRLEVFEYLRAADIGVNVHYIPVHTQPYYRGMGFREGDFPEAESYYAQALSLPLFPDLGDQEQDYVSGKLAEALT